jgi:hypothetical protein
VNNFNSREEVFNKVNFLEKMVRRIIIIIAAIIILVDNLKMYLYLVKEEKAMEEI